MVRLASKRHANPEQSEGRFTFKLLMLIQLNALMQLCNVGSAIDVVPSYRQKLFATSSFQLRHSNFPIPTFPAG